jgi:hypothetical protein
MARHRFAWMNLAPAKALARDVNLGAAGSVDPLRSENGTEPDEEFGAAAWLALLGRRLPHDTNGRRAVVDGLGDGDHPFAKAAQPGYLPSRCNAQRHRDTLSPQPSRCVTSTMAFGGI